MELKISASFSFSFFLLFLCELPVFSTSINDLLPSGRISNSVGLAAFQRQPDCSDHRCGVLAAEDAEFQQDSEINKRLLAGSGIKSSALDRDRPVCKEKNGKPYNCAVEANGRVWPTCGVFYYRGCFPNPPPAN